MRSKQYLRSKKMNELKPCPFCGGSGHVYEDERLSIKPYDFPKWYIVCKKCGIRTPTAKMEQVVRIWNRRAKDK